MNSRPARLILCTAVLLGAAGPTLVQAQTPNAAPASSAPAHAAAHPKKAPAAAATKMDLKAPPLSHIYPRTQLQYILAMDSSDSDVQEVSVKSEKYLMPVPNSQLQAIPWAFMHPADAWRVLTPIEAP